MMAFFMSCSHSPSKYELLLKHSLALSMYSSALAIKLFCNRGSVVLAGSARPIKESPRCEYKVPESMLSPFSRDCGSTASSSRLALAHSPKLLSMFASRPTADHKLGISFALYATLAARSATLNPCSGLPTLRKRSAFMSSTETRWRMSALSSLSDCARFDTVVNAFEKSPFETR